MMSQASSPSPMRPVAPPAKKQRSSNDAPLRTRVGGRDALADAADDAIARRRKELRRLQQRHASSQQQAASSAGTTTTQGLLARAKTQLSSSQPASQQQPLRSTALPGRPPAAGGMTRVRHSDIFPSVAKAPPLPRAQQQQNKQQSPPITKALSSQSTARRLDASFRDDDKSPRVPTTTTMTRPQQRNDPSRAKSAPPMRPPPPGGPPPPLAAEEPGTPPPGRPGATTGQATDQHHPSTTPRRDALRSLRQSADTPPPSTNKQSLVAAAAAEGSGNVRFVKELKQAQDDKASALRKIARLQEQISQLQKKETNQTLKSSSTMVPPTQSFSQVGFLSPLGAGSPVRVGSMTPGKKRVATPHPKRVTSDKDRQYLAEATESTPHEYFSSSATYIVRQPYGSSSNASESSELWKEAASQSEEAYQVTADVSKPSSLEVAAKIKADGSLLALSGVSTVRHQNGATREWKIFDEVDEMDKPLGCVMYIDGDANEKEYWLDAIYEEALATRETYCSSLISTASALQARKTYPELTEMRAPVQMKPAVETVPPPVVADACVGTEDMKIPSLEPEKQPELPPPKREDTGSSDVLSTFLGMVFSAFFGLIWLVLFRIPFRIFSLTLLLVSGFSIISFLWLYLADDHGAEGMGAGMGLGYNRPGIV